MSSINKEESSQINRGVELLLRRKKPKTESKTFQYHFEKVVSFFNKKVSIYFNFSFDVKNNK